MIISGLQLQMHNTFTEHIHYVKDVKKSNNWTIHEVCEKNDLDMMGLRHNEVNFEAMYDDNQKTQNVHTICF